MDDRSAGDDRTARGPTADWRLRHLAESDPARPDRPSDQAYHAMVELLSRRFLALTRAERARQLHLGPHCRRSCDLCWDIALHHAAWAANKLHRCLRTGPPTTRGEPVRDWVRILAWVQSPPHDDTPVVAVRTALFRHLPGDDPLLPLVHAVATQLLPSAGDVHAMRRTCDFVGDARRSVLAQRHGWAVKPGRDLAQRVLFHGLRERHPRGIQLLLEVLRHLDRGSVDPYSQVLADARSTPGDRATLEALIKDMLADPVTGEWFLREVIARQLYNEDVGRRRYRPPRDVQDLPDLDDDPDAEPDGEPDAGPEEPDDPDGSAQPPQGPFA
ncbi:MULTISPECIES: hypothetical protein [Frankia]|uniref:Uncharacterized protein n=1 Tax=Frankia alni (strain DSM 45986 / CECT 9034 / ACN14a) TaxID=326424 RepID=Q0RSE7_FRAAA|nr:MULTISPECIES: hypothetical protein [Frankia]CAJ59516.1 hypothetical protein FRAAL0848 [Frankia alni ACN14a]